MDPREFKLEVEPQHGLTIHTEYGQAWVMNEEVYRWVQECAEDSCSELRLRPIWAVDKFEIRDALGDWSDRTDGCGGS